jgi:hypothetical protein
MSTFDPELFLSQTFDGAMSTQVEQCPAGEYTAVVDDITVEQFQGKKDPSKVYTKLTVRWAIDDPLVKESLGRDKVTVRQQLFLDIGPNGLDTGRGKNVSLGRLREAVGQNGPGAWSMGNLKGAVAKIKVEHEMVGNEPQASVTGATHL